MNVLLGTKEIELTGKKPNEGFRWVKPFRLPPAYNTKKALSERDLEQGLVILSTLPNIHSHACAAQVLDLEEECKRRELNAKILHVACDCPDHWDEVRKLHPFLKAKGFTFEDANQKDINVFSESLGVGVKGSKRIAHGLFAFLDGSLVKAYIPRQQYGIPNIKKFLDSVEEKAKL